MTGPAAFTASPVFRETGRLNTTWSPTPPTVLRVRHVTVDFTALTATAPLLTLNLFNDVTVTAVRDRLELNPSGSFSWIGHLNDIPYSEVILVVSDGILGGNIALPQALYQVRYVKDAVHEIVQINPAAFPPD